MVTQNHRTLGLETTGTNTYFIITNSEEKLYKEIDEFVNKHKSPDNSIWVSYIPVKPSKINLRPEWSAEIQICEKNDGCIHLFQIRLW